ncbi:MAG: alpha/beta fold hydrolase [Thiotrichales bacterium]|nr:alpha/beta fold hydrolase [Thiotrichales bacterium]
MSYFLLLLLLPVILILLFVVAIHLSFRAPRLSNDQTPAEYAMAYQTHQIQGQQGSQLSVWWLQAELPSDTTVVILHGWGANKSLLLPLAKPFHNKGYNVLLLDAHNHGDSQKRGVSTMPKFAEDVTSAVDWLHQHQTNDSKQVVVVGHSVGAAAVLLAAAKGLKVNVVIAIASFVHPKLMMQRSLQKVAGVPGLVRLISNYVQWVIGHQFDDIAPLTSITKLQQPTLLVHGSADSVIPMSDFHLLCEAKDKSEHNRNIACLEIADADHDSIDKIEAHFSELHDFIKSHLKTAK